MEIKNVAQTILDRFFDKGAVLKKEDFDFLVDQLSQVHAAAFKEGEQHGALKGERRRIIEQLRAEIHAAAVEEGRQQILNELKEEAKKFREGFAYKPPQE